MWGESLCRPAGCCLLVCMLVCCRQQVLQPQQLNHDWSSHLKALLVAVFSMTCTAPQSQVPGCRVDRTKYQIQIPLPPKIDPSVTMMTVEEKPDVTYSDIGGCKEQIEKMREVVELPMLHPEKFVQLGIDPPKGVLCYGPPGTGKTLLVRRPTAPCVPTAPELSWPLGQVSSLLCRCLCMTPLLRDSMVYAYCCSMPCLAKFAGHIRWCCCAGACCGQPHRCLLHSRHWQRAGAEVRGRGCAHGARALSDGPLQEGLPHLLRRGGCHWWSTA